jgi:hypothetical protein
VRSASHLELNSRSDVTDKVRKDSDPVAPVHDSAGLTCSEGQVEDLLSEGESTEDDGEQDQESEKRATRNPSPAIVSKRQQK